MGYPGLCIMPCGPICGPIGILLPSGPACIGPWAPILILGSFIPIGPGCPGLIPPCIDAIGLLGSTVIFGGPYGGCCCIPGCIPRVIGIRGPKFGSILFGGPIG